VIEAFVTNLGKYNEGELCGEYLKLPATTEDVQTLLARIGVDGVLYEETFITDYETTVGGLRRRMGENESIDELNYLAALLADMDDRDRETFEAAISLDDAGSVQEMINIAQNLDCYDYYPGVSDDDDLGRYLIEELDCEEIPERLEGYFDYEAYGRDFSFNDGGEFTDNGYVIRGYGSFTEYYSGRDDIPDEYRIFTYPDPPELMPIRDQLAMYGSMVSARAAADRPAHTREDRV